MVQHEKSRGPSIIDELSQFLAWAWATARAPGTAVRWLTVARDEATPRSFGPMGANADTQLPPYATIISCLRKGALSRLDHITPEALAAALGVAPIPAAYLVAEVLSTSPSSAASGYAAPLPPNLAAALRELERAPDMQRMRSTVFARVAADAAEAAAEAEWRSGIEQQFGSEEGEGNSTALSALTAQVAALSRQVATLSDSMGAQGKPR